MFHSQYKQDEFLNTYFLKDKREGFFVDIGAHDGKTGSNSLFFETHLNWSGICVEPLPHIYNKLKQTRKSINLNCAVDEEDGIVEFYNNTGYTEMLSGLVKHYDPRHEQRRDNEINQAGGKSEITKVRSLRLETIFDLFQVTHVDYMSIDVEGAEFAVIKSINFDKVFIDIIDFEDNYPDTSKEIKEYLVEKGYLLIGRIGGDIHMIHKDSKLITEDMDINIKL